MTPVRISSLVRPGMAAAAHRCRRRGRRSGRSACRRPAPPAAPRRARHRPAIAEGVEGDLGRVVAGEAHDARAVRRLVARPASRASSRAPGRAPADARAGPRTAHAIRARRRPRCGSRRSRGGRRRPSYSARSRASLRRRGGGPVDQRVRRAGIVGDAAERGGGVGVQDVEEDAGRTASRGRTCRHRRRTAHAPG